MANLKNITELPVAESAEGLNLIVNDNGSAKQIAAGAVGAQADWAETDETSPAFVKNKPVEEWDFDFTCEFLWNAENNDFDTPIYTVNAGMFENVKNKILNGVPKIKVVINSQVPNGIIVQSSECHAMYLPENALDGNPESIGIVFYWALNDINILAMLLPDNTIISAG